MSEPIITDWGQANVSDFGKRPMQFRHRAHESPLFSDDALARLIETTTRENYYVNTMNLDPNVAWRRREGEIRDLSGKQVLEAVRNGRIWILLLYPDKVDSGYRRLLDEIYDEICANVPDLKVAKTKISILISSPGVPVFYHCDLAGQTLWQVRGQKTVYVYPNHEPYLRQPNLEKIVLNEAHEISLSYDQAWDEDAAVFTIEPGDMLHWPLNAPHRVDTGPSMNVSFTTEHVTSEVRRNYAVNFGNGILRRYTGIENLSNSTTGLTYWSRYATMAVARVLRLQKNRKQTFKVDFAVDPYSSVGFRDIPQYEFTK